MKGCIQKEPGKIGRPKKSKLYSAKKDNRKKTPKTVRRRSTSSRDTSVSHQNSMVDEAINGDHTTPEADIREVCLFSIDLIFH